MVWIFKPPGASIAAANKVRAPRKSSSVIEPSSPRSRNASRKSSFSSIAHSPRRLNKRFCISAAAALVYVRHRMRSGGTWANNSRATRSVNTRVLPEPAFAESHVETFGRAAFTCAIVASLRAIMVLLHRHSAWLFHPTHQSEQAGHTDQSFLIFPSRAALYSPY